MNRRAFLSGAATAAAAFGLARSGVAQKARQPNPATLARIAIMTLDFNASLKLPNQPSSPARTLEVFDLPEMFADEYGVHNLEFQHQHLASTEPSYLRDLRARLERSQSRMSNVNLEFGTANISSADPALRQQALEMTKAWIDHAVVLGCPRVMINQGQPTDENKVFSIPVLRQMGEYGKSKGIMVSVETRLAPGAGRGTAPAPSATSPGSASAAAAAAPPSAQPAGPAGAGGPVPPGAPPAPAVLTTPPTWVLLTQLIKDSGTYSNVDIGNVNAQNQGELHAALRALLPMTVGNIHTRVNPLWDLPTALRFINGNLGYTGLYSIEAPGGHGPVRTIYNVILDTI